MIRLTNRVLHLFFHQHINAVGLTTDTTGVHDDIRMRTNFAHAMLTVARNTWLVSNQSIMIRR